MIRVLSSVLLLLIPPLTPVRSRPTAGPARLENVRYYAYDDYTRVVLDLSRSMRITEKILHEADRERLFFDLRNCRFSSAFPVYKKKEIPISSGNLKGIRLGEPGGGAIRVVFDFDHIGRYNRFYLTSPFRIVFDIYEEKLEPVVTIPRTATPTFTTPEKPSMARQLGLGVRRIVLDPGHGGKDPGAVNLRQKLQEKEITLDIAHKLKKMLEEHAEFEIMMTRNDDRYVSLEERTAIANSTNSDLFISIHTNSSRKREASGLETYFLSLTTDPWAMSVAATENAMSAKSIGELRSILDQIVKSSMIAESKILSHYLHKQIVTNVHGKHPRIPDLGIKQAPFYVLLGARMPACLVELSFISYEEEARLLSSSEYRRTLAAGLYLGITSFINSLGEN